MDILKDILEIEEPYQTPFLTVTVDDEDGTVHLVALDNLDFGNRAMCGRKAGEIDRFTEEFKLVTCKKCTDFYFLNVKL